MTCRTTGCILLSRVWVWCQSVVHMTWWFSTSLARPCHSGLLRLKAVTRSSAFMGLSLSFWPHWRGAWWCCACRWTLCGQWACLLIIVSLLCVFWSCLACLFSLMMMDVHPPTLLLNLIWWKLIGPTCANDRRLSLALHLHCVHIGFKPPLYNPLGLKRKDGIVIPAAIALFAMLCCKVICHENVAVCSQHPLWNPILEWLKLWNCGTFICVGIIALTFQMWRLDQGTACLSFLSTFVFVIWRAISTRIGHRQVHLRCSNLMSWPFYPVTRLHSLFSHQMFDPLPMRLMTLIICNSCILVLILVLAWLGSCCTFWCSLGPTLSFSPFVPHPLREGMARRELMLATDRALIQLSEICWFAQKNGFYTQNIYQSYMWCSMALVFRLHLAQIAHFCR